MSPTKLSPETAATVGLVTRPRVVGAADCNDVMLEQLEFLIGHAEGGDCGCALCARYFSVRAMLLEAFNGPAKGRRRSALRLR